MIHVFRMQRMWVFLRKIFFISNINKIYLLIDRDGLCMLLLLLQKRIFTSYYWKHIVDELISQKELAKNGAGFLKEIIDKQKKDDKKQEDEDLKKIDRSFNRIKDKKQQLQNSNVKDAETRNEEHFEGLFWMK